MLWIAAGVVTLGFFAVLEVLARRYGEPGPLTNQVREVVFAPKSGTVLYASMALMMVVLTWRQRFVALGAALGIDLVFWFVRWLADAGMMVGNGALLVTLACAVIAVTRRAGEERALLLKGVGLALLLVTGRKVGDTWLLITWKSRPLVLDQYVAAADHALGAPSWLAGRIVEASGPVGAHILDWVYVQLAVAAVVVALYQLRNVAATRRFPRHHLLRTFLVIGVLGPGIYMIFPVVGPVYAYGTEGGLWAVADLWPNTLTPISPPHPMPFDEITPRNCMPSLHTAWATAIFLHSRKGPTALRCVGVFWLLATLCATLGFGYHYGADIVAGVVFTLTIDAGLRTFDRGWDRAGIRLVVQGTAVFTALLLAYRYLSLEMAGHPWLFGPLVLLSLASVIYGYAVTTGRWDREERVRVPTQQLPEPRRELTPPPDVRQGADKRPV
ncbi:phosphatase PAP2 family protein [Streptomyces kunmingensis]|uniref:Phosphatase PAP2 family protein n=1 Tax=Streptomyces kunmingensis TaxID=68225 RepID=A0ABU6C3I3_9ACTN|nr:phosphatase PAP2 family protein [Streptomyces kunmingensis]MEB3958875.1 phosphatase PAP2 family protein [Streptomyces kunmingensis]